MDSLLPQLLAFPPHPPPAAPLSDGEYDNHIQKLLKTLKNVPSNKLVAGVSGGGNLLEILDPRINSLPYLYTLLAHIQNTTSKYKASEAFAPDSALWMKMMEFMAQFDGVQIRYAGSEIRCLIELVAARAENARQPMSAIEPIRSAILRIDPSSSTLTSSHVIFVRLCLEARAFAAAYPVLDQDIYHLPASSEKAADTSSDVLCPFPCSDHESSSNFITSSSDLSDKLDYASYLKYFLYGAMLYMGLKQWDRAILFLEIVISAPTANTASKIQVEAYKKWILVGLIHKGHILSLPKTTNSQAAKMYQSLAKAYVAFAEVFKNSIANEESDAKLTAEAQVAHQLWEADFNFGLVNQAFLAFRKFSVLQLAKTYAALTIAEVTRRTSRDPKDFGETGDYVRSLISSGQINATITEASSDPARWVLRFVDSPSEGPQSRSEEQQYADLVRQTQKVECLWAHVREADRKLSLSKEYIQEAKKAKKSKGGENGGNGSHWDIGMNVNDFDNDEDMMGDL